MTRILLLEPSRLLAKQYIQYLESIGYEVVWREDAQSGVIVADSFTPDVVLVELLLAGHSGTEFLYEFRSYADWQKVPAIVLTSVPRHELAVSDQVLAELGVVQYLYKPSTSLKRLGVVLSRSLPPRVAKP